MKSYLKIISIVFIILLSIIFHNSSSSKEQVQTSSSLDEIVKKIESLFPKVEGKILSKEDNTVKINLGSKDGLSPGIRLAIFREGKEFFHPVTKVVMGRLETPLGILEIKEVMEETSLGVILDQKEDIKTGDGVRITSARIGIALLFTEGADKDTIDAFYEALEETGRFRIIEDEKVKAIAEKEGLQKIESESKEDIKRLGKALDIEGIIFLGVRPTPKGPFLRADLVYSFDGKHLITYESLIPSSIKKDIEFPLPERKDYWKAFDFNYRARLLGIGDLDGDRRKELVISDGKRIRVYRFEGSELSEIWADKERIEDNHIALDVADINRDGKAEVFVTNYGTSLNSFVIEYRGGAYRRVWDNVPLFFRVMDIPEKGETLIAQGLDGNIHEYSSKDGRYIKERPLRLPPGIEIYGFVFINLVEKGNHILFIDDDDYLNLYNLEGVNIWRSKERYGGYMLYYERPHWIIEGEMEKVWIKGRVITKDYGGRWQKVIIVRNIPITYVFREFRGYKEAEIIGLGWNGFEMVEEWQIGKLDGFIADYGIGNLTNNGKENLCLIVNPTIMGGKSILLPGLKDVITGKSRLLIYNLSRK